MAMTGIPVALAEIAERGREARGVTFRQIEGTLWEFRTGPHRVFYVLWYPAEMMLLQLGSF
jgi:hypothetical protein